MTRSVDKQQIRANARNIRQQLPRQLRDGYANQLVSTLSQWKNFQNATHIGAYLAQDCELNLSPLIEYCWNAQKSIYLPILKFLPPNRLWFSAYNQKTNLVENKYRILEPESRPNNCIRISTLDIVLFPLVAFDGSKNRVGMGGGFYDRTFGHLKQVKKRPLFVGVAYKEQQVNCIASEDWDLPLDAIATPNIIFE